MPDRIRPPAVVELTGLSLRQVQNLACRGMIPGAAKLGSVWTFDALKLRRWIREQEDAACRRTCIDEEESSTPEFRWPDKTTDDLYEQVLAGKHVRS